MSTKKKVCFVLPGHWTGGMGGAEYQAKLIIEGLLHSDDFEIHYLCRYADINNHKEKYKLNKIGSVNFITRHSLIFDTLPLYRKLKELRPDIIYQRQGCSYTGVSQYYANKYNCKLIWHIASDKDVAVTTKEDSYGILKRIDKKILEYGIQGVSNIIAQTKEQRALIKKNYNVEPSTIIANFHPEPQSLKKQTNNRPIIIWVSNFKPIKAPEKILELATLLPEFDFIIIGRSSGDGYKELLRKLEETNNTLYLGAKSQKQVNELIWKADFLLNTSLSEGFPNTFIQAWGRGTPILSLNVDPNEVIESKKLGKCCNCCNELARFAKELWNNKQTLQKYKTRCIEHYKKHHTLSVRDKLIREFFY